MDEREEGSQEEHKGGSQSQGEEKGEGEAGEAGEDEPAFFCKADSTEILSTLLTTLLWDKDQVHSSTVLIFCTSAPRLFYRNY
jgi:hypothetical protein